jgi:hypothetical protein
MLTDLNNAISELRIASLGHVKPCRLIGFCLSLVKTIKKQIGKNGT